MGGRVGSSYLELMEVPSSLRTCSPAMNFGSSDAHGVHESGGDPAVQTLARGSMAQRQVRDKVRNEGSGGAALLRQACIETMNLRSGTPFGVLVLPRRRRRSPLRCDLRLLSINPSG